MISQDDIFDIVCTEAHESDGDFLFAQAKCNHCYDYIEDDKCSEGRTTPFIRWRDGRPRIYIDWQSLSIDYCPWCGRRL
jgi:hypothetical protein